MVVSQSRQTSWREGEQDRDGHECVHVTAVDAAFVAAKQQPGSEARSDCLIESGADTEAELGAGPGKLVDPELLP